MRRLFVPTFGPSDWRRLLADPETQWRHSKSAFESAVAWESARGDPRGLPPDLAGLLDTSDAFRGATLLLGLPEHQVSLDGGGHASQTDFWALLDAPIGVTSVAVEAKAGETFDKPVSQWLADASPKSGKPARLRQLCGVLEIDEAASQDCRYQLLHRPVTAILEAKRFRLRTALFLVQAFGPNDESFADYRHWARLLGVSGDASGIDHVGTRGGVDFWTAWLRVDPASDATVRGAV